MAWEKLALFSSLPEATQKQSFSRAQLAFPSYSCPAVMPVAGSQF
jgi:hypothetical protein